MLLWLSNLGRREEGQGFVEYALILILVFVVVIAILALTRETWGTLFSNMAGRFNP